jgi:uncharacterized membrane protein
MNGFLTWVFSWVCGQDLAHTWAPGGNPLPMCQRCTGFYVGAAIAFVLMLWFRPRMGSGYRWLYTILVLAMTPFGFHLVPHGAVVRTISGLWFGFGVVGLLWLLPGEVLSVIMRRARARSQRPPVFGLMIGFVLLPTIACWDRILAAEAFPWLALVGLAALAGLLITDIALLLSFLLGFLGKRVGRQMK